MRKGLPPARSRPLASIIEPCLPRPADRPPAGRDWLHEIKHDGFRSWYPPLVRAPHSTMGDVRTQGR